MSKRANKAVIAYMCDSLSPEQAREVEAAFARILDRHAAIAAGAIAYLRNGADLNFIKSIVPHGQFESTVKTKLGYSTSKAEKLMRIARKWAHLLESVNFTDLPSQTTLDLLSSPSTPDPVLKIFDPRVDAGEKVKPAEVKAAIDALKPPAPETTEDASPIATADPDDDGAAPFIAGTVDDAEWFDPPSIAALIPVAPASPCVVASDATMHAPALPETSPPGDAQMAAVREIARTVRETMGYDGMCVASLIRHGLGVSLADAIDAECGHLPDNRVRLESDDPDPTDNPLIETPPTDPDPFGGLDPFDGYPLYGKATDSDVIECERPTKPARASPRRGAGSVDRYGSFGPNPFSSKRDKREGPLH